MNRNLKIFFLITAIFSVQTIAAQNPVLNQYVKEGIESNLVLKQRNLSLENAINALQQAKSFYLPTVDFQTQYTTASGGRSIDLPVGDMLNPVYTTLNQITGQNAFPHISNEKINFLPKNYYDARVRVSVPILNTDIRNNTRIKEKQTEISEKEVEIYMRELVKEIKVTYFNYMSVMQSADIYRTAIDLAKEGKRVNERLIEAGRGLHAYVLRSETEVAQAESDLRTAELQAQSVQRYFNALLNRDADAEIKRDSSEPIVSLAAFDDANAGNREELESLTKAIELHQSVVKMNEQAFVPKLSGFGDLGSQAEQLRVNDESLYYMIGLQLNIPIFSGGRNRLKIKEANTDLEKAKLEKDYVERQLNVSVTKTLNEALAALTQYESAKKQLEMAETYSRLIHKGYSSGVNTYIETVDARSQLTSAKIAVAINQFKVQSALAVLERETASFPLQQFKKD